jgi:hypothetical protein
MTFAHPWAMWLGAAAAAMPILVHLLTKPKPVRYPFSTLRFLRKAVEQRRARDRLRDWILLALRTAAVLLIATAIARPKFGKAPLVEPGAPGDAVRVVMLDVSHSMAASNQGVQRFEKARSMAADYLAYQANLRANLILAGASAVAPFDRPTENLAALREEIRTATPTYERLNLAAALRRAGELLSRTAEEAGARRELVIVSDFQRSNWSAADFAAVPEDVLIRLEYVDGTSRLDNVAVQRIDLEGGAESGGAAKLRVELGNFSPSARRARLEVRLDDDVQTIEPVLAANGKTVVPIEIACPRAGWRIGTASLINAGDALAADDRRAFAVHVRPPPAYLLVTRQPSESRGSSYFIERAAAPLGTDKAAAREKVVRLNPERLDRDALQGVEVVVIDHPGRLPKQVVSLLVEMTRRGRGVLYIASEPVDAENLRAFAEAAGGDFKPPVEFLPAAAGSARRNLFLSDVRRGDAPFRVFGDGFESIARPLRFGGGLATRKRDAGLADEVLAAYSDGSAALTMTSVGAGRIGVFNTDLGFSNIASSPAFVPLLGEWLAVLRGRQSIEPALACGEGNALYLPLDAGPVEKLRIVPVSEAAQNSELGALASDSGGVVWRWKRVGPPGAYKVMNGETVAFVAVSAAPAEESDLAVIPANLVETRLAGGRSVETSTGDDDESSRDDWWTWPAVVCVLCLFGELAALKAFRS